MLTVNIGKKMFGTFRQIKDCVKIKDAAITVSAGGDGIRSTNTEKSNKGFVYIETGNIDITSGNDGIQAATVLKAAYGYKTKFRRQKYAGLRREDPNHR